jgi:general secretion pathway protein F
MLYRVKTLGAQQQVGISMVSADSELLARRQFETRGIAVLSVARAGLLQSWQGAGRARFPLSLFSQELLALISSGVSVVEAIETLVEKEQRPTVRDTLLAVLERLQEGKPLSLALEDLPQAFPPLFIATVRASEKTGALQEALTRYIAYATQLEGLRAKLVSAAIYPVMLIGVSLLVILFLMGFVVPRFAHIYEDVGGDLPFMSRALLQLGQGIEAHGVWLLVVLVALAIPLGQGGGRWLGAPTLACSCAGRDPAGLSAHAHVPHPGHVVARWRCRCGCDGNGGRPAGCHAGRSLASSLCRGA